MTTRRVLVQPINPLGDIVEHGGFFFGVEAAGNFLEGIPQDSVGAGLLVHGEIAFKHAAVGAESVNRVEVIVARCRYQFI